MAYDDDPNDNEPKALDKFVFICCGKKYTTTDPRMICPKCKKSNA